MEISTTLGATLQLFVTNADNQLTIFMNGAQVYDRATEGDPTFINSVDLSGNLAKGRNVVLVVGVNWGGPFHVKGSLKLNGNVVGVWDDFRQATQSGIVNYWSYIINVS